MSKREIPPPTDAELAILRVLWQEERAIIRHRKHQVGQEFGLETRIERRYLLLRDSPRRIVAVNNSQFRNSQSKEIPRSRLYLI